MTFYDQQIPAELVAHSVAICGDRGRMWLDELPKRIADLENKWSIQVLAPFPSIEFNFVAPALRSGSEEVVVKIAPPYENQEFVGEAAYLRSQNGKGVIRLLAEDHVNSAILLERAVPGESLTEYYQGREPESVLPAIDVLRSIVRPAPNDFSETILLYDWFDGLRRYKSTDFPREYATKALDLYDGNLTRTVGKFYLHGDFHPGNIVTATRSPWLAIDPKGIVGPLGYEIAVFLNNFHWWQETRPDIRSRLDKAVGQFAEAFDLDQLELRQWAFAQMVLGAWWTFDEMPEIYNNEVAKADIWNV